MALALIVLGFSLVVAFPPTMAVRSYAWAPTDQPDPDRLVHQQIRAVKLIDRWPEDAARALEIPGYQLMVSAALSSSWT